LRARIAAELLEHRLLGRTSRAALGDEQARGKRDDKGRNLRNQPVSDGELGEDIGRARQRHAVMRDADDDAAEYVDGGDHETGDGVAAHELRGTVHGAEEGAFLLELPAPALRFLVVDQAGGQVRVDRHLLAWNGVEREARPNFRNTRRTLCDHDEIDGDEDGKDDQADDEIAAHHELRKARHDIAGRMLALASVREDHTRRRHVQGEAQDCGDQQHRRECREIQRTLDPQRDHQDQGGQGDRKRQPHVDQHGGNRQDQHGHDGDNTDCEADVGADPALARRSCDRYVGHRESCNAVMPAPCSG